MMLMINFEEPYIIGETAYLHEGDINYLNKMVDEIAEIKLNAVKFHLMLDPESYMQKKHPLMEELRKWLFDEEQWDAIIENAIEKGLDVIALCDDVESIQYVINNNKAVQAIELHGVVLNDHYSLMAVSKFKGQIILGIGGSTMDEIQYAVDFLKDQGVENIILMYGFQSYPTNYSEINLSKMLKIKQLFNLPLGYADHTAFDDPNNEVISILAATMGFNILEKHYTPDPGKERIDYHAAIGKAQMLKIKELLEIALTIYGDGQLKMSKAERDYGNVGPMKKAIVARKHIKKGEVLSFDNLWFKRTMEESTVQQKQFLQLIGLEAIKDIEADEIIDFSKVKYEFKTGKTESFTHLKKR